jgi:hypothetical protein
VIPIKKLKQMQINGKPLFSETFRVVAVGLWSSAREGVWSSDRRIRGTRASVVYEKQGTIRLNFLRIEMVLYSAIYTAAIPASAD